MARSKKETDLKEQALNRYQELITKRSDIEDELKGLQLYLKAVGEIGAQRRGQRKRVELAAAEGPSRAVSETKPKAPARKARTSKSQKKVSATGSILSVIGKSGKGISIDGIMKETGFSRQTVNGVLNRMKKQGKVKAAKRGTYITG